MLLPIWRYKVNPSVTVHLRNSNKQHVILHQFYNVNALFTGNRSGKFHLNLPKQTVVIAAFVRSFQSTSFSGLCKRYAERPETEVF